MARPLNDTPGSLSTSQTLALAGELRDAELRRVPLGAFSARHPELNQRDAYAVQSQYSRLRIEGGTTLVGRKIGCTSKAIQEQFGVDTPDYGTIFADMVVPDGGTISRGALIRPMVEPELAFVLKRELGADGTVTRSEVLDAVECVLPCLEIIDSRFDWRLVFVDTVADNGSSARCVFGAPTDPSEIGVDFTEVQAVMYVNGVAVDNATGDAVLGHPADSVAWLANTLLEYGESLAAGDYVLSGSFMTARPAEPGDVFRATFTNVGDVSCRFN